jgi:hypothetical protein
MTSVPLTDISVKTHTNGLEFVVRGQSYFVSANPKPAQTETSTPKPPQKFNIPQDVVPQLERFGFSVETADTTLQLVCLPENSSTEYWKQYNYIEALHDGRGYTVTLYGACSGTGDLLMIFESLAKIEPNHPLVKFIPTLRKARGDNIKGLEGIVPIIKKLGDDPAWRRAVWEIYQKLYWSFAADFCDKTGECKSRPGPKLSTPLMRGFLVDASLNHGSNMDSMKPILKKMKNPNEPDEKKWFLDFCEARRVLLKSGYEDLDTSKSGSRCQLWAEIAESGNWDLKRPLKNLYKGYWSSKPLTIE